MPEKSTAWTAISLCLTMCATGVSFFILEKQRPTSPFGTYLGCYFPLYSMGHLVNKIGDAVRVCARRPLYQAEANSLLRIRWVEPGIPSRLILLHWCSFVLHFKPICCEGKENTCRNAIVCLDFIISRWSENCTPIRVAPLCGTGNLHEWK